MDISVVIPVYNEDENILAFYSELNEVLKSSRKDYEIIFVNDGSTDKTPENLEKVRKESRRVKIIDLSRRFGQTAAIAAGLSRASGKIIVTMDGDSQNDPHDIPALLREIEKGYHVVSGWRRKRKDPIMRVMFSRLANRLISLMLGLKLHDYGCTLKALRRDTAKNIKLYGEMHRFIPAVASWNGAKIKEIEVNHRPRKHKKSKYGLNRIIRVFLDLLVMIFLSGYSTKPIRFFGGLSIMSFLLGALSLAALVAMKLFGGVDMTGNPFIILSVLFFLVSVQLVSIGLIGEINIRTYYESQGKTIYNIKHVE